MKLRAQLTLGWLDTDKSHQLSAVVLHKHAEQAQTTSDQTLAQDLRSALQGIPENSLTISGLDNLFRKRVNGAASIKQLLGAIANIEMPKGHPRELTCRIDAFAYSFLKGAKNFDFILPCYKKDNETFINNMNKWDRFFIDLTRFERLGERSPSLTRDNADDYLAMRRIFTRTSARDEIRTIATLLLSGPSTLEELSEDLGLNYTLGQRTLASFENPNVVALQEDKYRIHLEKLPQVVFFLREVIGLDLLQDIFSGG